MIIENDILIVKSKPEGAELTSILNKKTGLEYIWQAGMEWPKHAPVLFPIVGQLKDNIYYYDDEIYSLERHGFARTNTFLITAHETDSVEYSLLFNDETLRVYPFQFELLVSYELKNELLEIIYTVFNNGEDDLYFSIGAHPAFKIPLNNNERYDDYYLEFNKDEDAQRWMLHNGLLDNKTRPVFQGKILQLTKTLFNEDALVFKNLKSDVISIKSKNHSHGLNFHAQGFPYFGIWAAKDADFICLEHGMALQIM